MLYFSLDHVPCEAVLAADFAHPGEMVDPLVGFEIGYPLRRHITVVPEDVTEINKRSVRGTRRSRSRRYKRSVHGTRSSGIILVKSK